MSAASGLGFIVGGDDVSNLETRFIEVHRLVAEHKAHETSPERNKLLFHDTLTLPDVVVDVNWVRKLTSS